MRKKFFICSIFGLFATMLGFSSCQNEAVRDIEVPTEKAVSVKVETFVKEADGSLSPFTTDLRAVIGDASKATITGDGSYFYNDLVNLKIVANNPYTLHQLYEKQEKGGFTKANGTVDEKEKTLSFNITEDMTFVAIFTNVDEQQKGYRNLKVDNKSSDFSVSLVTDESNSKSDQTKEMFAIGEEVAAIKTATGEITGLSVINSAYKAWNTVGPTPASDWLTVNIDKATGKLSFVAKPFVAKAPARKAVVKVGKDATDPALPSAWVSVTVTQSSFYKGIDELTPDSEFTYGDGTIADIKAQIEAIFDPNGDKKDFKDLDKTLKGPIYVSVPTYKDGELLPKDQWVKEKVEIDFGKPSQDWLKQKDSTYAASANQGKVERSADVVVSFKVDGKTVDTTTVNVKQKPKTYDVNVEID